MAEKSSTLVLEVDLECHRCYKKIRKVLCKLQDGEKIKTISFNDESRTVTVSGPFDPEKLSKKLQKEAGHAVIKAIKVKKETENKKPEEKETKAVEKPAEPPAKAKEKTKIDKEKSVEVAAEPEAEDIPKSKSKNKSEQIDEPDNSKKGNPAMVSAAAYYYVPHQYSEQYCYDGGYVDMYGRPAFVGNYGNSNGMPVMGHPQHAMQPSYYGHQSYSEEQQEQCRVM